MPIPAHLQNVRLYALNSHSSKALALIFMEARLNADTSPSMMPKYRLNPEYSFTSDDDGVFKSMSTLTFVEEGLSAVCNEMTAFTTVTK